MEHSVNINNTIDTRKDKAMYDKSKEIIDAYLSGIHILEIGNPAVDSNTVFTSQFTGGILSSETKGILTLGACLKKSAEFTYRENDKIIMAYPYGEQLYLFPARILDARESTENDLVKINALFNDRIKKLEKILGPIRFVVIETCVLTEPVLHQRRQYPRSSVKWDVYFKLIQPEENLDNAQKIWIDNKIFEFDRGYFKIQTVDVSAGGFKSEIKVKIPRGTVIECIIEIKMGKFKAIGRITSKIVDCSPNNEKPEFYDMRVQFMDLSDSIKTAMAANSLN